MRRAAVSVRRPSAVPVLPVPAAVPRWYTSAPGKTKPRRPSPALGRADGFPPPRTGTVAAEELADRLGVAPERNEVRGLVRPAGVEQPGGPQPGLDPPGPCPS